MNFRPYLFFYKIELCYLLNSDLGFLNIIISKPKFRSPDINRATMLQTITSHPKTASNRRRKPILTKNPAIAERLKIPNFLKKTPFVLFVELFRQIQKYEQRKLLITAASKEIVGDIIFTPI